MVICEDPVLVSCALLAAATQGPLQTPHLSPLVSVSAGTFVPSLLHMLPSSPGPSACVPTAS